MNELLLQRQLIRNVNKLFPYTILYAQEWEVYPGYSHLGKGDLVFKRPHFKEFLVVETKYLTTNSGKTARNRRRMGRKKVVKQALRYGRDFKKLHPNVKVEIATYTNMNGLQKLR